MDVPGVGTVRGRTNSEIEVSNRPTLHSKVITSVVIEPTAPSRALILIINSCCDYLK